MKTSKETWKSYKKDIVVGVITSLLSSAILWFAGWLFDTAPRVGATLPTTIENIIYTKAATVTEYTPFLLVLELIWVVVMTAVIFVVFMTATIKLRVEKEGERELKEMVANAELEKCREEAQTPEGKQVYKRKLRRRISAMEKEHRQAGRTMWLLIILLILLITLMLSMMVNFVQRPIELKKQFDLEVQVIAPYVDEDVIAKLKSDWVMMYSKAQYLEIYKTIDAELEKLGISRYYWTTTGTIVSGAETPAPTG